MAATQVFVDRAVQGDLPEICVRTGRPADVWVPINKPVGGMGAAAWVLVVLGPIGWIALAIVATFGTGRETLTVLLPYSRDAWDRHRSLKRMRLIAGGAALIAFIQGMFVFAPLWLALAGMASLVAIAAQVRLGFNEVDVRLDGSRRWVTLIGVHENFASRVEALDRAV